MRLTDRYRLWGVYLLIAIFTLPSITQTVHSCLEDSIVSTLQYSTANKGFNTEKSGHSHHCESCPICQFTLYSFEEADILAIDFHTSEQCTKLFCQHLKWSAQQEFTLFQLRAPPAQA